jgi:hypothetical protein
MTNPMMVVEVAVVVMMIVSVIDLKMVKHVLMASVIVAVLVAKAMF